MKVSVIVTTKNEEKTIGDLLTALSNQTVLPDEVIIADAGSSDKTPTIVRKEKCPFLIHLIRLSGDTNRSVGRNEAVSKARNEHLLFTDAGCIPKSTWIKEMLSGFASSNVVAGVTHADARSVFEKCVAPYVLIMPDRIDHRYLPATRALGITKQLFTTLGGFDPKHAYGEDYAFARKLREQEVPITVCPNAVVKWRPRKTLFAFCAMIFLLARGDAQNRTWRPKILTIYLRYLVFLLALLLSTPLFWILLFFYALYSLHKGYRYVRDMRAVIYLPLLQATSDFAVMTGTLVGLIYQR